MLCDLFWKDNFNWTVWLMCPRYFATLAIGLKSCLCKGMKGVVQQAKNTWRKLYPCSTMGKKVIFSPQNIDVLEQKNAKEILSNVWHFQCSEQHLRMPFSHPFLPMAVWAKIRNCDQLAPCYQVEFSDCGGTDCVTVLEDVSVQLSQPTKDLNGSS